MTAKAAGGAKAPSMGRAGGGAAMPGGYPCPSTGCVFRAARRYNLSVHMRLHTGEKPYKCDAAAGCSATFAWRSSMLHHLRTHHAVASSAGRRVVINNRPTKREAGGVRGARRGRGAASNSSSNSSGSGSSSQPVPGASTTPSVDGPKPAIALGGTEDSHGDGAPSARPEDATPTASTVATDGATASVNKTLSCLAAARKQSSAQAAAVPHAAASPAALSLPEGASSLSPMAIKFTPSPVPPLAPGGAPAVAPTPVPAAVASPPLLAAMPVPVPVAPDSKWAAPAAAVRADPALAAAVAAVVSRGRARTAVPAATAGAPPAAGTGRKAAPPPLLLGLPSTEGDGGASLLPLSPLTPAEQSGRGSWSAPPPLSHGAIAGMDTTAPVMAAAAVAAWNAPPTTDAVGTLLPPPVGFAVKFDAAAAVAATTTAETSRFAGVGGNDGIGGAPPATTDWLLLGMDLELFDDNMDEVVGAATLSALPTPSASVTDLCMGSLGIVLPVPPRGGGERVVSGWEVRRSRHTHSDRSTLRGRRHRLTPVVPPPLSASTASTGSLLATRAAPPVRTR
eukprot:TRINITY_DN1463_c0_g1_i1.p1 TRINITY_DN1463_c0_g1~~TRINITY_DN1463_c0_g1_i1.p1  ORF type:complete len:565 (-),score=124.41 TRINITY_DN1463_c0_g1_i1:116-1810(-)